MEMDYNALRLGKLAKLIKVYLLFENSLDIFLLIFYIKYFMFGKNKEF